MTLLRRKLLRHEVADHLRSLIMKKYRPGDRLPSEAEFCKELRISLVTLREALSIIAHEGLIVRKHGSGTYVAEHAHQPVAVLIDLDISQPDISPFFVRLAQRVRYCLEEEGIDARLYVGRARSGSSAQEEAKLTCREFLEDLAQNRIGGVVAVGTPAIPQFTNVLREKHLPFIGNTPDFPHCIAYRVEDMIRLAAEQLAARGRKRVALVGRCGQPAARELQTAATKYGLQWEEEWIQNRVSKPAPGEIAVATQKIMSSLKGRRPDGLIVDDDTLFAEAAVTLVRLGIIVPEEVMVVTHANRCTPLPLPFPVVKIEADPDALAAALAAAMKRLLAGERVEKEIIMQYAVKSEMPAALAAAIA